jgi:hypothetical protein
VCVTLLFLAQTSFAVLVGLDYFWRDNSRLVGRYLVYAPLLVHGVGSLPRCAYRAHNGGGARRAVVHTAFLAYALALPPVLWAAASFACIDDASTETTPVGGLRRVALEEFAERSTFVCALAFTMSIVRALYEYIDEHATCAGAGVGAAAPALLDTVPSAPTSLVPPRMRRGDRRQQQQQRQRRRQHERAVDDIPLVERTGSAVLVIHNSDDDDDDDDDDGDSFEPVSLETP